MKVKTCKAVSAKVSLPRWLYAGNTANADELLSVIEELDPAVAKTLKSDDHLDIEDTFNALSKKQNLGVTVDYQEEDDAFNIVGNEASAAVKMSFLAKIQAHYEITATADKLVRKLSKIHRCNWK